MENIHHEKLQKIIDKFDKCLVEKKPGDHPMFTTVQSIVAELNDFSKTFGRDPIQLQREAAGIASEIQPHKYDEKRLVRENEKLTEMIREKETKIEQLEKQVKNLQSQIPAPKKDIGNIVYIHSNDQDRSTEFVKKELVKELSLHLKHLTFRVLDNEDEMAKGSPLLALCLNKTRLTSDAVNTIKDLKDMKNTALVVFHHREHHALTFPPSRKALTGQQFNSLNEIFDMAFLEKRGLYTCDLNTEAITGITTFLKKYIKPNKRHSYFF